MGVEVLTVALSEEDNQIIESWLSPDKHNLTRSPNFSDGMIALERSGSDIVILAAELLSRGVMKDIDKVRPRYADLRFFSVADRGVPATVIVEAMKMGLTDVLWLPLKRTSPEAIENALAEAEARCFSRQNEEAVVAASPEMMSVVRLVHQIAPSDVSVLICGPIGSGRKTVARTIHDLSPRRSRPFIHAVCSTLTQDERGRLSEANGLFAQASGGTLVLDGVLDLEKHLQTTLMALIGEGSPQHNVRVISITDKDIHSVAASGLFRSDLAYALGVVEILLLPLCQRREDLLPLATLFLKNAAKKDGKHIPGFGADAINLIRRYQWPGNSHELLSAVLGAAALTAAREMISGACLSRQLRLSSQEHLSVQFRLGTTLQDMERDLIDLTLQFTREDKSEAAKLLGVATRTIYRHLEAKTKS